MICRLTKVTTKSQLLEIQRILRAVDADSKNGQRIARAAAAQMEKARMAGAPGAFPHRIIHAVQNLADAETVREAILNLVLELGNAVAPVTDAYVESSDGEQWGILHRRKFQGAEAIVWCEGDDSLVTYYWGELLLLSDQSWTIKELPRGREKQFRDLGLEGGNVEAQDYERLRAANQERARLLEAQRADAAARHLDARRRWEAERMVLEPVEVPLAPRVGKFPPLPVERSVASVVRYLASSGYAADDRRTFNGGGIWVYLNKDAFQPMAEHLRSQGLEVRYYSDGRKRRAGPQYEIDSSRKLDF